MMKNKKIEGIRLNDLEDKDLINYLENNYEATEEKSIIIRLLCCRLRDALGREEEASESYYGEDL